MFYHVGKNKDARAAALVRYFVLRCYGCIGGAAHNSRSNVYRLPPSTTRHNKCRPPTPFARRHHYWHPWPRRRNLIDPWSAVTSLSETGDADAIEFNARHRCRLRFAVSQLRIRYGSPLSSLPNSTERIDVRRRRNPTTVWAGLVYRVWHWLIPHRQRLLLLLLFVVVWGLAPSIVAWLPTLTNDVTPLNVVFCFGFTLFFFLFYIVAITGLVRNTDQNIKLLLFYTDTAIGQ